jgi:hypothetical protein
VFNSAVEAANFADALSNSAIDSASERVGEAVGEVVEATCGLASTAIKARCLSMTVSTR